MNYSNISLIGFMGSGKTTVGRILASRLKFLFIDIDRVVELESGREISGIFGEFGEDYFRKLETEVINKLYKNKQCIFACGGGAVIKKENMKVIRGNSLVIYLGISPAIAVKRLKNVKNRPLIEVDSREETIREMIAKREKLYRKYAHIIIDNDNITPEKASEKILSLISSQN